MALPTAGDCCSPWPENPFANRKFLTFGWRLTAQSRSSSSSSSSSSDKAIAAVTAAAAAAAAASWAASGQSVAMFAVGRAQRRGGVVGTLDNEKKKKALAFIHSFIHSRSLTR